ncbi:uncharacterized protein B0J16DRAFT_345537 [Fusarium flagelliforme]|uniref:uncharacterized protein n=1 Tax=Fusarium flagelliforme TaxID=2675880 RepID=UPI001E8D9CE1|nr:uncharacterized protein B0J16DRAFT_345537 [Fusarium flagelliforme]KAH7183197.1 hypothetical protein B0J16DRAFT_345537 [Fusarium flagelliforme]
MSSGVTVNESVLKEFEKVKYMTSAYAVFKLSHDNTEFVVDTTGNDHDWETFLGALPENEPRLAVSDFRYKIGDEERNKMVYVVWSPEDAKVKSKMVYANTRGTLRQYLAGISREIEASELSELSYDVVLGRMPAK